MATFAIGDVHGNANALRSLLDRLRAELSSDDTLVFLGDTIDRGPDSKGCVDEILQLRQTADFEVVTLLGNHEEWMLATMEDYSRHSWLLGADAFETVRSYSPEAAALLRMEVDRAGPRLILSELQLSYDVFFAAMPESHQDFFRRLQPFHRGGDAVFVHAGVDPGGKPVEEHDVSELVWGLGTDFPAGYRGDDRVIYGHHDDAVLDADGWPSPRIIEGRTWGIDTISTGVLTAVRMPDGAVFQSDRFRV